MPSDPATLAFVGAAVGSAAGAFYYVLKLLVEGKLHTASAMASKDKEIADLLEMNARLAEANKSANDTLAVVISAGRTGHASPR